MAIKTDYVDGDPYNASDHNDENTKILANEARLNASGADVIISTTTNRSAVTAENSTTDQEISDGNYQGTILADSLSIGDIILLSLHINSNINVTISGFTGNCNGYAYIKIDGNNVLQLGSSYSGSTQVNSNSNNGTITAWGVVTSIGATGKIMIFPSGYAPAPASQSMFVTYNYDAVEITVDTTSDINIRVQEFASSSRSNFASSITVLATSVIRIPKL